jgi:hypothetical protein
LRLRGWLWDRGVRDMAYLAGAMCFVVGIPVEVGDNLNAEDEDRQNQRYGQQAQRESL